MASSDLIYKADARKAILKADPSLAYCIDNIKPADAVEVVHAYWTGSRFNPMTGEYEEYCSHCCAWSSEYGKPYCPNCGAKMDGDGNG